METLKNIKIRKAEITDSKGIATVKVKSWQKTYRGLIPDSFLDSMSIQDYKEKIEKQLKENTEGKYHNLVFIEDSQIVGILTVGCNTDGDLPKEYGQLYSIYLLPGYEGMGIGSKLLVEGLSLLRTDGYKKATLWVLDTNTKARSWYEHKGWEVEGKTNVDKRDTFDLNEVRYIIEF